MQLHIDFGGITFQKFGLPRSFNAHFDGYSANAKMNIGLPRIYKVVPDLKPSSSKPYRILHIQKPMNLYNFAVLRESTIVSAPCLMLLELFFFICAKTPSFEHGV